MITFKDILSGTAWFVLACALIYIFSRIQMKAWTYEINKFLMNKYTNLKSKKDEQKNEN
jgi:hypothetical protein